MIDLLKGSNEWINFDDFRQWKAKKFLKNIISNLQIDAGI